KRIKKDGRCLRGSRAWGGASRGVDPHGIVHVIGGVGIGHEAVTPAVAGVSEDEDAAAGLRGIVSITDEQDAVTVADRVGRTQLENVLDPALLFGPAQSRTYWPARTESLFDRLEMLCRQARVHVPFLDPVEA